MSDFKRTRFIGFTFVELLITIVTVAIVVAWVAPAFKDSIMNNRISTQTNAFVGGLNYARTTALSQNIPIIVCPFGSPRSTTCGDAWSNGWLVVSAPATGVASVLQAYQRAPNDPTILAVPINGTATPSITFDTKGFATSQAYFKLCDSRGGAYARSVEVLPTGFVQSSLTMGVAAWDGSALTCP